VWCSHHAHFYMESERFRMSLLAGSVPVKVVPDRKAVPPRLLFDYLVLDEEEVAGRLREMDFAAVRRRFRDDFRAVPGVAAGLAGYLVAAGVLRPGGAGAGAGPEGPPATPNGGEPESGKRKSGGGITTPTP